MKPINTDTITPLGRSSAAAMLVCALAITCGCTVGQSDAPARTYDAQRYVPMSEHYLELLKGVAENPIVIRNIEAANEANNLTHDQILEIDLEWRSAGTEGSPIMAEVLQNDAAEFLVAVSHRHPEFAELFLIDQKGCVTAENLRTTDYWQGDEAKWSRIFVDKYERYFVDNIEFDLSTRMYLHHYSIPVRDKQKKLIGVLVVGIEAK